MTAATRRGSGVAVPVRRGAAVRGAAGGDTVTAVVRRGRSGALLGDRRGGADATSEPDPGPAPEAVFDRVTGPYLRRNASVLPGARACDEDA